MFTRLMCAGLVGAMALATPVQPAKAWGGGGGFAFGVGALTGLTLGTVLARPYYAPYPYAYAPYPYPYPYAPAPVYAVPPPGTYAYPPGYAPTYAAPGYAPPGYAPPSYAASGYAAPGYAPQAVQPQAPAAAYRTPSCGAGQFFNTLTGTCDRR